MGQYWHLVNIDRWAVLGRYDWGLKLLEVVDDRSAEQLLGMLRKRDWIEYKPPQERLRASKNAR